MTNDFPEFSGKGGKNRSRAKSDRNDKRELHYKNTDEGQGELLLLLLFTSPGMLKGKICRICAGAQDARWSMVGSVLLRRSETSLPYLRQGQFFKLSMAD